MKEEKRTDLEMVMVRFTTRKEENTQVTGITTKWKAMELCFILMEELPTKDNGKMTLFMVKVFYSIKSLK